MRSLTVASVVLLGLLGCNRPSADDYFSLAEHARDTGNMNIALENYRQIVDNYPGSSHAEEAQFNIASITQNTLHQHTDAIREYRKFEQLFPRSSKAPAALFLQGYIFNNDLNEIDSAAAAYRKFLAMYPEHEMAASARFELEHLGKSPDQLLPDQASEPPPSNEAAATGRRNNPEP